MHSVIKSYKRKCVCACVCVHACVCVCMCVYACEGEEGLGKIVPKYYSDYS